MAETDEKHGLRRTARSLPIALLRAREAVMGAFREMLAQSPVNETKWRVLRVLDEIGPQDQKAVAEAACLLLPSLTRILHAMEAEGYVTRETDPADRRRSIVRITPSGRAVLDAHAEDSARIARELEARMGREKLDALLDLLEELQEQAGRR